MPDTKSAPRRLVAMVLTLLFAFCVLITSAPHRHGNGNAGWTPRASAHRQVARTTVSPVDTACALCDWLYAPTLPAAAPTIPPVVLARRGPLHQSSFVATRLLRFASSRSSSRAPPTV